MEEDELAKALKAYMDGGGDPQALMKKLSSATGSTGITPAEKDVMGTTGGEGLGAMGTIGLINAGAQIVGSTINAVNPGIEAGGRKENVRSYGADVGSVSFNSEGVNPWDYDFAVSDTKAEGLRKSEDMAKEEQLRGTLESLPMVGGVFTLMNSLEGVGNTITKKASKDGGDRGAITKEYEDTAREYAMGEKQAKYASLFAAGGYLDIFGKNSYFAEGGFTDVQEIEAGFSHEEDPMGGITIGEGKTAEAGEVRVKLPKGEFIFTNRF